MPLSSNSANYRQLQFGGQNNARIYVREKERIREKSLGLVLEKTLLIDLTKTSLGQDDRILSERVRLVFYPDFQVPLNGNTSRRTSDGGAAGRSSLTEMPMFGPSQ
jgi:hypothetical protein